MSLIHFLSALLLVFASAQANLSEHHESDAQHDQEASETALSPYFGTNDIPKSGLLSPKSGYSPVQAAYNPYSPYLGALYGYGSGYNRYGLMPYTAPYYGYGSGYGSGYGAGYASPYGYGYAPGYGFGGYNNGRSAFGAYGYPGYSGLGYRFGYNSASPLRAVSAVSAAYTGYPGPIPAVAGATGLPAGFPAYAAPVAAYRQPALPLSGKDAAAGYAYAPAQRWIK